MPDRTRKVALAILILCFAAWAQTGSHNPLLGTWKFVPAKSHYTSGPPPRSVTVKYQPYKGGKVEINIDSVDARGTLTHAVYIAAYDGKEYAVKGDSARDTVSLRRISADTTEITNHKRGKIVSVNTIVVAPDGKTRVATITTTNSQGQQFKDIAFFEKE